MIKVRQNSSFPKALCTTTAFPLESLDPDIWEREIFTESKLVPFHVTLKKFELKNRKKKCDFYSFSFKLNIQLIEENVIKHQIIICYAIHEKWYKNEENTLYHFLLHTCLCPSLKKVYRSFSIEDILRVWAEQHLQILPVMHKIGQKWFL